jgi:hypothetical protein
MFIQRLFNRLKKVNDTSVDAALAAALPTADPARLREIALLLLARRHPASAAALVIHFERLPLEVRQAMTHDMPHLGPMLRCAGRMRDLAGCERVVRLIREGRFIAFADILAEQLRAPGIPVRQQAATGLVELVEHMAILAAREPVEPAMASRLQRAVEEAVVGLKHHHQPAVLLAMVSLLPIRCPQAMTAVSDPKHPAHTAMRQMILESREPAIRRQLLFWMTVPEMAPVAIGALMRFRDTGRLADVLMSGHLLALGPVRRALGRVAHVDPLLPSESDLDSLPTGARRHLPVWVAALPLTREAQARMLARIAATGDPITRLAALRQLIAVSGAPASAPPAADGVCAAIERLCRDADEGIARTALRHLLCLRWVGLPRLLLQLTGDCAHESVRALAARELAPTGFLWLWNTWPTLPRPRRIAAAKALVKLGDHMHEQLGRRLTNADRHTQCRAADMIAQLNQGALFESALIALARGSDARLAATAVRALASAESEEAGHALEASLAHSDTRVRANAVEALGRRRATAVIGRLREMAGNDENRPRANAIGQLINARAKDGREQLVGMLADVRSRHRISALWLVERADRADLSAEVAEMALTDPDASVRARAAQTLRLLVQNMRKPLRIDPAPAAAAAGSLPQAAAEQTAA